MDEVARSISTIPGSRGLAALNRGVSSTTAFTVPVILIEFDHQLPADLRHCAKDPKAPNREHIHAVVRTPNGNDYGKDLLRQHYQQHPHATAGQ